MYYSLNSKKLNSEIYSLVYEHLDELLLISSNEQELKDNIKLFTQLYLEYSGTIYFVEGFSDVLDTIKTAFWSKTLPTWSGKISLYNWLGGVASNVIATKSLGINSLASSLVNQGVTKLTNNGLIAVEAGKELAVNAQILRLFSVVLFPTILFGLVIYRLVNYKDIILIKNFELNLKSVIETLRLSNKSELNDIYNTINKKYEDILVNKCSKISDEKMRLTSASNYYVKYITEDVMARVIFEYLTYLKKNNIDISYITNFKDLCTLNIGVDPLLFKRIALLREFYLKLLQVYVFDEMLRQRYIKLLDKSIISNIKVVYV